MLRFGTARPASGLGSGSAADRRRRRAGGVEMSGLEAAPSDGGDGAELERHGVNSKRRRGGAAERRGGGAPP